MPNRFSQYLAFELPKQIKFVRTDIVREQYDAFSLDEMLQFFRKYIEINLPSASVRARVRILDTLHRLDVRYRQPIQIYDTTPKPPHRDLWYVLRTPHPREDLVGELDKLADSVMEEWQAALAPRLTRAPGRLTARVRPLQPGYSIGVAGGHGSGTTGAFIRSRGGIYILSNAHIMTANPFNDRDTSNVTQPSPPDTGTETVAITTHHFQMVRGGLNRLDAAIARVQPTVAIDPRFPEIGELAGFRDPRPGETVRMVGRTSGLIQAVVVRMHDSRAVTDWMNPLRTVDFGPVAEIARAEAGHTNLEGDSGGVWIAEDNKAVALNFSGGEWANSAFAFPMTTVMAWVQSVLGREAGLVGIDNSTLHTPRP
jgi:hypothetical protein